MKISKKNALELWEAMFGSSDYAEDFDGGLINSALREKNAANSTQLLYLLAQDTPWQ